MTAPRPGSDQRLARELVEELLRTSLWLSEVLGSLFEELPEDAFPGEDKRAVLLEMVAGTGERVAAAAGQATCREAIALIASLREAIFNDLKTAARLAADRA